MEAQAGIAIGICEYSHLESECGPNVPKKTERQQNP